MPVQTPAATPDPRTVAADLAPALKPAPAGQRTENPGNDDNRPETARGSAPDSRQTGAPRNDHCCGGCGGGV